MFDLQNGLADGSGGRPSLTRQENDEEPLQPSCLGKVQTKLENVWKQTGERSELETTKTKEAKKEAIKEATLSEQQTNVNREAR